MCDDSQLITNADARGIRSDDDYVTEIDVES
jgi:hypothetical protein